MDKIINVADYLIKRYHDLTGECLDEMKLHKLLYFTQREAFAILGNAAFEGDFEGWKFGPVSRDVRNNYYDGKIVIPTEPISNRVQYISDNVIMEYGALASWRLSELSHQETSWNNARKGLRADENGNVIMSLNDIKEDAKKVRPYDHVWDMYYDEFDDCEDGLTEDSLRYDWKNM